ncbi:MAG TPA: 3-phosphoshikimate 1-carboxyvinyltransferase [Puia sp.]|jgi:3-phosphoshikimate 1-carboxyvinyltransferase
MLKTIEPSALLGTILAPASKSSMQRACAAALLRIGETVIHHPGHSNDDKAALRVIGDLGAIVTTMEDGSIRVQSKGVRPVAKAPEGMDAATGGLEVNCGESGLGLRMFAPIMGLSDRMIKVRGEGSLVTRPMDFFDEIFPLLGIRVVSNGGKLPLEIQGPLKPRDITIDGSLSSQFLTGLLLSFAASGAKGVTIKVNNLKSKPYIDLTLAVMKHFGWEVGNRNYEEFYFSGAVSQQEKIDYTVEGDWSGGAFLLVAGALAGPITVKGLDVKSTQADKAILQAIGDSGAKLAFTDDEIVAGPGTLKAFEFDATECPDLFPPLAALAAYCDGTTVIRGVSRLAHKESDRGLTLRDEFGKMGLPIVLDGDRMLINGGGGLKGATVHSRHDHRIAMACAVAALKAGGPVTIEEAEAINKSYPDFYEDLKKLGGQL